MAGINHKEPIVSRLEPNRRANTTHRLLMACAAVLVVVVGGVYVAAASPDQATPGLDEQVQAIKSDVLAIANELAQLEEKLLYPSNTQVAVFVSIAKGEDLVLDSVSIEIDEQPAARHIYSLKELEALRRGGVQRIYMGNVAAGEHRLDVTMTGRITGGFDFDESASFAFTKEVQPAVVELELSGRTVGGARIVLSGS